MKKNIFLIIGIIFLNISFGQEIDIKLNLLGYKFVQNGERLNWKELVNVTESNYEANLLIKKARTNNKISNILALLGGGLTGIPLGQSINNREPNWTLAYIGVGMGIVGIPISLSAFNKVNEGVDKYNFSLKSASYKLKPVFKFFANSNGVGLSMSF